MALGDEEQTADGLIAAPTSLRLSERCIDRGVAVWRWFVPLPRFATPKEASQAHRVLAFCLAMSVWAPVFAAIYQSIGLLIAARILVVAEGLLIGIPFLLRATRQSTLCGNLLVGLAFGVYTSLSLVAGGPTSPVAQWYVSLPVMAAFVVGLRWAVAWTGLTLAVVSGLFAAEKWGVSFAVAVSPAGWHFLQWSGLVGIVLCIAALTLVFKAVEHRHHAAMRLALSRAETADRAKSEFLANMSHEIRTPLTAILGYAEVLMESAASPGNAEGINAGDALRTIHRNGEHLLQVINDILDLSKIEAGRLEIERIFASPSHIVAGVVELMRVRSAAKGLLLETVFDQEAPDTIETDPTRLRQVLLNIVGNAVKFTDVGAVRVATRWSGSPKGPGTIEFEVSDSGIGMSREELTRLFCPFSQADSSTTRRFGGSGLGLAISQRLLEKMGGTVTATSEPGAGSRFTVRLPVAAVRFARQAGAPGKRAPAAHAKSDDCLAGWRILLAEDGADNQRLISHLLRRAGAEVASVDNGQAAFEMALAARDQGAAFDVVLMDMQMPILGGCEATERLRASGYRWPIIALTAHALRADHDKCLAAGCDDVCTKPIDRPALCAAIRRQAGKPDLLQPASDLVK